MTIRIGHGYDVHRFGEGDLVIVGGVRITHVRGVVAHSDGDVALHALIDAMLGALALGDIGHHFPDDDDQYKNAESLGFLRHTDQLIRKRGYSVQNLDITVLAQRPKLAPHIPAMRRNIADALKLGIDAVSVKATTSEKVGFIGREEGIAAYAVVLLQGDN